MPQLLTVVELQSFIQAARGILEDNEVDDLKSFLAANPETGVVMIGTGGVRKLRWGAQGKGKRGGGRVIYYYYDNDTPLFLIALFTKGEKSDLSQKDKAAMAKLTERLVSEYSPNKHQ